MGRLPEKLARDKIELDLDAGLHALRHRFLTGARGHADAFTLLYIVGHDTMSAGRSAVSIRERSRRSNKAVFNPAEVVELADTPS